MLPFIPLHFLCTHFWQLVHYIELFLAPLPQTPHGHLSAFCITFWRSPLIVTLVLFIFTFMPLLFTLSFHSSSLFIFRFIYYYHKLFWRLFLHLFTQTSLPILTILQLLAYACPPCHFSEKPVRSFFQVHKTKIELLSFNSKILLHLSYNKNGISASLTFHKAKLHIIYLSLLPNFVFKVFSTTFIAYSNNLIPL